MGSSIYPALSQIEIVESGIANGFKLLQSKKELLLMSMTEHNVEVNFEIRQASNALSGTTLMPGNSEIYTICFYIWSWTITSITQTIS